MTIHFGFTVECPHCSKLFEVNHLTIEVLFTGTVLGICPSCGLQISAHLASQEPPAARPVADRLQTAAKE